MAIFDQVLDQPPNVALDNKIVSSKMASLAVPLKPVL
jgi:hypothetical protein